MREIKIIAMAVLTVLALCTASLAAEEVKRPAPVMFDAGVAVSSLMAISDGYIKSIEERLEIAAMTEEAASGDWERIRPLLERIEDQEKGEAIVWFAICDGSYCTVDAGVTGRNLKDRPYFPKVLAGEESVGELVISRSTGQVSAITAVPIKSNGQVTGMLGVSLFTRKLSVLINEKMGLKDDAVFFALNRDHITVINKDPDKVYLDPEAQGDSSMTKAMKEMLSKDKGNVEYDFDGRRNVCFMKSPYTGWWYAIGLKERK